MEKQVLLVQRDHLAVQEELERQAVRVEPVDQVFLDHRVKQDLPDQVEEQVEQAE
jgi:hypothetical protein